MNMENNNMRYQAADCSFNQANYPHLIGKMFANPPAYVVVIDLIEAARKENERHNGSFQREPIASVNGKPV
jgi:hypothetical protein